MPTAGELPIALPSMPLLKFAVVEETVAWLCTVPGLWGDLLACTRWYAGEGTLRGAFGEEKGYWDWKLDSGGVAADEVLSWAP